MKAIILAGGVGSRMNSQIPKVLHKINDKYLIEYTIETLSKVKDISEIVIVVGFKSEYVQSELSKLFPNIQFFKQSSITGTGQALLEILTKSNILETQESFIMMNGDDSMFYSEEDITKSIKQSRKNKTFASFFVVEDNIDRGYRKIILDKDNNFVELTKLPSEEGYTLTGFYIFNKKFIHKYLEEEAYKTTEGELKITEFLYNKNNIRMYNPIIIKQSNWFGVNTQEELEKASLLMQKN